MALSDEEQRLLDQLEASLAAEDPRLVQKFGAASPSRPSPARFAASVAAFVVGLTALVVGITWGWWLSVIGFVVMFGAIVSLMVVGSRVAPAAPKPRPGPATADASSFMDKLGDRWSQRHDQM